MFPFTKNAPQLTQAERLQQAISTNLAKFSTRSDYTSEEIVLFKRVQLLLQRKDYEEASYMLERLVSLR